MVVMTPCCWLTADCWMLTTGADADGWLLTAACCCLLLADVTLLTKGEEVRGWSGSEQGGREINNFFLLETFGIICRGTGIFCPEQQHTPQNFVYKAHRCLYTPLSLHLVPRQTTGPHGSHPAQAIQIVGFQGRSSLCGPFFSMD